ncbi:MAG: peptidoglycan DD-metalloendopeptidase family protein [candidate division Zixibacteria bacterium]|nr:peptidoglycan DD-metalloendopeptidase family protein [candidate division Zixibacteria bacterium]
MSLKKRFSILFIPHQKGRVLETKVSLHFLIFLFIGFVLLLSSGLFFSLDASNRAFDKLKLRRLQKENSYLETKLDEMNSTISSLKSQMAELIDKEKEVRMVFGLPEVDAQIRELGVGGPIPSRLINASPEVEQAYVAETELEKLLRQARFEKENFEQVYSSLSERKNILDHTPSIHPTSGYLSCGFGMRRDPFTGRRQFHRGVDLATDIGTPVYVTADGVVSHVTRDVGLGKLVRINHLYGYTTVYAHLSRIAVKRGQHVKRGEIIGAVGNTGYSTGPHLHYEVHYQGRAKNPLRYFLSNEYLVDR